MNRCERCNRELKDQNARFGWRCAEILGVTQELNNATDDTFNLFMNGYKKADSIIQSKRYELYDWQQACLYPAMIKREFALDLNIPSLVSEAVEVVDNILTQSHKLNILLQIRDSGFLR